MYAYIFKMLRLLANQVEQIFEAVHGTASIHLHYDSNPSPIPAQLTQRNEGFYNFLVTHTSAGQQAEYLCTPPSQMLFLWQVYIENVDPFIKVLHVPTVTKTVREMRSNHQSLDNSTQTLLLAISLAAVISLEDAEVDDLHPKNIRKIWLIIRIKVYLNFEVDKDGLVERYRIATEKTFGRVDLFNDPGIAALQGIAIYLNVLHKLRRTRQAWCSAGLLIRIAASMGLHSNHLPHAGKSSPFENEMRRRLWWQICLIDSHCESSQQSGFQLPEAKFDTKVPTNVDDKELDPGMFMETRDADKWTDMTIFLIRCEAWELSRKLRAMATPGGSSTDKISDKIEIFQQYRAKIEASYLRHMDPNIPLHSFVATSTRLFLTKVDLVLQLNQLPGGSSRSQPVQTITNTELFTSSFSIVEYTYALQKEPAWSGWRWQIEGQQPPWHALWTLLEKLGTEPWDSMHERAWSSVQRTLTSLSPSAQNEPRYKQLLAQAAVVQRKYMENLHPPEFGRMAEGNVSIPSEIPFDPVDQSTHTTGVDASWIHQAPFPDLISDSNDSAPGTFPSLDMDWQSWDYPGNEAELLFGLWDL